MRQNLADEIAGAIRDRIAGGALSRGQRINETELSSELEVSRTPLREALSRLASEGFVTCRARRGFFVQALEPPEIEELYQLRAILDPAALRLAGLPSAARLEELSSVNRAIETCEDLPDGVIRLDDRWHEVLLSPCPNRVILDLIRQFVQRTRPLEREYMSDRARIATVVAEHDAIIAALERGDLDEAAARLRDNMRSAIPVLVAEALEKPNER